MIHLQALPGAPGYEGSVDQVIDRAIRDAAKLKDAGFPALLVENFGDAPFFADHVPAETVAGMTRVVDALIRSTQLAIGVNVLRNDAVSAVGIAAATGAPMIRVNVLTGVMYTDQGPIVGRAAEVLRRRAALQCEAEIWADVMVKHATPPPGLDVVQSTLDTLERGGADAIVVSGPGTGSAPELEQLKAVRSAAGDGARIVVGSGANPENLADLGAHADTVIVGSYTKIGGIASNPVDPERATRLVERAAALGLV